MIPGLWIRAPGRPYAVEHDKAVWPSFWPNHGGGCAWPTRVPTTKSVAAGPNRVKPPLSRGL